MCGAHQISQRTRFKTFWTQGESRASLKLPEDFQKVDVPVLNHTVKFGFARFATFLRGASLQLT